MSALCTASAQRQNSLNSHGSFARHRFNEAGLLCSDDGLLSRASKDDAAAVTAGVHQGSLTRPATLEWTGDRSVLHSSGAACLATKCLQSQDNNGWKSVRGKEICFFSDLFPRSVEQLPYVIGFLCHGCASPLPKIGCKHGPQPSGSTGGCRNSSMPCKACCQAPQKEDHHKRHGSFKIFLFGFWVKHVRLRYSDGVGSFAS